MQKLTLQQNRDFSVMIMLSWHVIILSKLSNYHQHYHQHIERVSNGGDKSGGGTDCFWRKAFPRKMQNISSLSSDVGVGDDDDGDDVDAYKNITAIWDSAPFSSRTMQNPLLTPSPLPPPSSSLPPPLPPSTASTSPSPSSLSSS